MSTDDVWSVPDTRNAGEVGDAGAIEGTQGMPGGQVAMRPPCPNPAAAVGYSAYPVMPARPPEPYPWAWLTAGILLLIAGVLQAAVLLANSNNGVFVESGYYSLGLDVIYGVRAATMVACGALIFVRRTREFGGGLTVGFALVFVTNHMWQLDPTWLKFEANRFGTWLAYGVFALVFASAVIVLIVLLPRRRDRVGERRTRAERRLDRIVAVALGFTGALLWTIATLLGWLRLGEGTPTGGVDQVSECCSWAQDNGLKQVGILVGGAMAIVLALFAATLRSKIRAVGLLLGVVAAGLSDVLSQVASQIAPMQTVYGFHYRQIVPAGLRIVVTGAGGFWLALAAMLILCGAAVSRLMLGPRKAAYPQNELERIAT